MKYSIIIPTYNKIELTKKCLKSLFLNTKGDFEIIVVDNASGDGTKEYLQKEERVTKIYNSKNVGFSKANNRAAKSAKGEILVFLNNDTEVQPGWIEGIEKIFNEEKNIGAVGVKMLFPDGKIQHAGVVISEDHIPRHIYRLFPAKDPKVNKKREFQAVTAACIAIPKIVFEKIGGFDEGFTNGLEDVDLCLKIKKAGYRIVYQPESVVIHHESASPDRNKHTKHNYDLYIKRWREISPDEHQYYREDGLNGLQIFLRDIISMAYNRDDYGLMPKKIKYARFVYIPIQKTHLILKLLFTLDFQTLGKKIKKVTKHA